MVLSASRRTDIPCFYFDWFVSRLSEGFLYVKNPFNPRQVSYIGLSPETVDCIVFWTKNPAGAIGKLPRIDRYPYYFQYTLNPYGQDLEPSLPRLEEKISLFRKLSESIGRERVVWRYDPVLLSERYGLDFHKLSFKHISDSLRGYTDTAVVSFLDGYRKINGGMKRAGNICITEEHMRVLAESFAASAAGNGQTVRACAEAADFSKYGISRGSCIDGNLIKKICGREIKPAKDPGQRKECGCAKSVDVGAYDTCPNGCVYCYANRNANTVAKNLRAFDESSPILCGKIENVNDINAKRLVNPIG